MSKPVKLASLTASLALLTSGFGASAAMADDVSGKELAASRISLASAGQTVENLTADELAKALAGSGVKVSNAEYTGAAPAAGTFTGFASAGIDEGVALSTGSLVAQGEVKSSVAGPNDDPAVSTYFDQPGDDDLEELSEEQGTLDAAALEFDFVPAADSVNFNFVFGSEDYDEYDGEDEFNDLFGIFVNGTNCASIDGDPVSVKSVGASTGFRDNSDASIETQLDGLSAVQTCAAEVVPGETNHVKFVIADVSDDFNDSAVFIQANDVTNKAPTAGNQKATTKFGSSIAVELSGEDPEGKDVTYEIVTQPKNGTVTIDGNIATYTPDAGYSGKDRFTYTASDGTLKSEPATVKVTVQEKGAEPPPTSGAQAPDGKPGSEPSETPDSSETAGASETPDPAPSDPSTPAPQPAPLPGTGSPAEGWALLGALGIATAGAALLVRRRVVS